MAGRRPNIRANELAAELRHRLAHCLPGMRLPGRTELRRHYGCGLHTAREAVAILVREGLLEQRPRGGTFVTRQRANAPIMQIHLLDDRRLSGPRFIHEAVLLGVADRCRVRQLPMQVSQHEVLVADLDSLRQLAKGDPFQTGWIVIGDELPPADVLKSWIGYRLPFVIVDDFPEIGRVNLVARDIRRAIYLSTERLLALGHRRIACAGLPVTPTRVSQQRLEGFISAHKRFNLHADPGLIVKTNGPRGSLLHLLMPLLQQTPRITAIVAMDQYDGCECIAACDASGLAIPGQISVISGGLHPHQPPPQLHRLSCMDEGLPQQMGRLAVDLLAEPQDDRGPAEIWLQPGFVDRGSVGSPPEGEDRATGQRRVSVQSGA